MTNAFKIKCVDRNTGAAIPYASVQLDSPITRSIQASASGYATFYIDGGSHVHGYAIKDGYNRTTIDIISPDRDYEKILRMTPGSPTGGTLHVIVRGGGHFLSGCRVTADGKAATTGSDGRVAISGMEFNKNYSIGISPPPGTNFESASQQFYFTRSSISTTINLPGIRVCTPGEVKVIEYCPDGTTKKEWQECSQNGAGWVTRRRYDSCPEPYVPPYDEPYVPPVTPTEPYVPPVTPTEPYVPPYEEEGIPPFEEGEKKYLKCTLPLLDKLPGLPWIAKLPAPPLFEIVDKP